MPKPSQYTAIQLWGRRLGSFDDYIEQEQERAAEENAPIDAIFRHVSGRWARASELPSGHSFREVYVDHIRGRKT